jgi:hypothetical protein
VAVASDQKQLRIQFFEYLFGTTEEGYVCIASSHKDKGGFKESFFMWPLEQKQLSYHIDSLVAENNVWFCVSFLDAKSRMKEHCRSNTFAWADLDEAHPADFPEGTPEPTAVLETSPGRFQGFWRFKGNSVPSDLVEDYSRRLTYHVDADKGGWSRNKLLRVPWTKNFKYDDTPQIKLLVVANDQYDVNEFDKLIPTLGESESNNALIQPPETSELPDLENILIKLKPLDEEFRRLYSITPNENADWSRILWRFINKLFELGLDPKEVYVVAINAACNKYKRDNRPVGYLWRDVVKAQTDHERYASLTIQGQKSTNVLMPHLVDFDDFEEDTFIKMYKTWANDSTDAPEQYHELGCFILLSAICSAGLYLELNWGKFYPNLWGLVLGESTLVRKAQPLDARILTSVGWKLMGEINIGDEVIGQDGKPTKVVGISPRTTEKVVRVRFGDGSSTECTLDLLWTFKGQGSKSEYKTWPLSKILEGGLRYGSSTQWIRHVPIVEPIEFDYQSEPIIEPYALGLLLGDGGLSQDSVRFTNHLGDAELVARLMEGLKVLDVKISKASSRGETVDYRITTTSTEHRGFSKGRVNKLLDALRELGLMGKLSNKKFIPDQYKFGSIETRLAVLQGLMDTDGWVSKNSAAFCSSSLQLALDVRDIVWSLGGWSSISQDKLDSWNVRVNLNHGMNPFRLERKRNKVKRVIPRARTMRDIEFVGEKEVQCIKVDNPSGLYVTDNFIVTHNTTSMRLVIDTLKGIDDELILATDGSAEGILTGLSHRPKRVSIYWKDEVSGLFDSINRKDYLAGLPETLTQLYDVPSVLTRLLRKETISIEEPYFIFFGGGIRDKVYSLLSDEYVLSGFLPRFLVVSGENDLSRLRRTGPPTAINTERKDNLITTMCDIRDRYNRTVPITVAGQTAELKSSIEARLTSDAWETYGAMEDKLTTAGMDSDYSMLLLPTFTRMSFSLLKMALLVAASRRNPDESNHLVVESKDIKQAAFYIEKWGHYSIDLMLNTGISQNEKLIQRAQAVIVTRSGITKAEFMQRLRLSARDAKELLETMSQRGLIDCKQAGRGMRIYPLTGEINA